MLIPFNFSIFLVEPCTNDRFFTEESPYLMVLKGSQVIDLSTDGSGRAGQLPPVVGITGMCDKNIVHNFQNIF